MRLTPLAIAAVAAVMLGGCDQWMARTGLGKQTMKLPCGQKLTNVTWKGQNAELWTLTRPFRNGDAPETHSFKASTMFGVFEGEVTLIESKCA